MPRLPYSDETQMDPQSNFACRLFQHPSIAMICLYVDKITFYHDSPSSGPATLVPLGHLTVNVFAAASHHMAQL